MKKAFLLTLFIAFTITATQVVAQTNWKITKADVTFKIRNAGINISGSFQGFKGKILFSPKSLDNSRFIGIVQAGTINTGIKGRDRHLRKEDFFHVAKYPTIKMKATRIAKEGDKYYAYFNLTIKGTTKPVKVPFNFSQNGNNATFDSYFEINRRDFGVGGRSLIMNNTAKITLKISAVAN